MAKSMGKGSTKPMISNMKEPSMTTNLILTVSSAMPMGINIKVTLRKERSKGKEYILGVMDHIMKVFIKMI